MKPLYKSPEAREAIMALYDEKLADLKVSYKEIDVETNFGRTRVIHCGNPKGRTMVMFHGINIGSPLTIEALQGLCDRYNIYAIDTVGQATKSAERPINMKDNSYAYWADEVLSGLNIKTAIFIGASYGAFILQKLITERPERAEECVFIVPSGFVNGELWQTFTDLTLPLMKFMLFQKDEHLKAFLRSFLPAEDEFMYRLNKELLTGCNIDYRRPGLLKESDVKDFNQPVYFIVASDDIFFPGPKVIKRGKELFKNIQGIHTLQDTKHIPTKKTYYEICDKIKSWI